MTDELTTDESTSAQLPAGHPGRRQFGLLWAATVLGLIAVAPFGEALASAFGPCWFKSAFGFPCPTCGATRAALLLADFQIVEAVTRFPLPAVGWIVFIVGGLASGLWVWLGHDLPEPPRRVPAWVAALAVVAVLGSWAVVISNGG